MLERRKMECWVYNGNPGKVYSDKWHLSWNLRDELQLTEDRRWTHKLSQYIFLTKKIESRLIQTSSIVASFSITSFAFFFFLLESMELWAVYSELDTSLKILNKVGFLACKYHSSHVSLRPEVGNYWRRWLKGNSKLVILPHVRRKVIHSRECQMLQ